MLKTILLHVAVPLLLLAAAATLVVTPFLDRLLAEWFRTDTEMRASIIIRSIADPLGRLLGEGDSAELGSYLRRVASDERLIDVQICRPDGTVVAVSGAVPAGAGCGAARSAIGEGAGRLVMTAAGSVLVSRFALGRQGSGEYALLVHDLSFADSRRSAMHDYVLGFVAVAAVVLSLLIAAGVWSSIRRWGKALLLDIRGRHFLDDAHSPRVSAPILAQVRQALRDMEASQRLEIEYQENWTPSALQQVAREFLGHSDLVVVSNREPYVHSLDAEGEIRVQVPPSGMVTALEPVMRACSGVWVAHGGGDADRRVADRHDRIAVPPEDPAYQLRRVWLSAEEQAGYYDGLSNEGLWPLCHLAYVRPQFRASDWRAYCTVNERFAAAVTQECRAADPVVLVQDYHFAPLPQLLRQRLPDSTIVLFWHIPWPNAETFSICPWKRELLHGMLEADIIGFHTRYHCQNFLSAVDRLVEATIDHEHMTVTLHEHVCRIAAYPISIQWPERLGAQTASVADCRKLICERYRIEPGAALGVGVERWDFTKGVPERFAALEYLLETRPRLIGRVTLLQILAPSRSLLPAYQMLQERTLTESERINRRFGRDQWQPIMLVTEYQEPSRVFELYRAADFCMVSSLHDGMNLVAKEFIAARDDEDGVLILSTFTGACRELVEALLVNPFDPVETARALEAALDMSRNERRDRMRLMRRTVKHNNVYRWAGRILIDAAKSRQMRRFATPEVKAIAAA
jgi:trehalose 6-phosphate synthase